MGLKKQVEQALATIETEVAPVEVTPAALRTYSDLMRQWSGWSDAVLEFGEPGRVSPYASCDVLNHKFVVNADLLTLNPYRVLNTINPFRLRQEAVLTGAMLHEAGHARHSRWMPSPDEADEFAHPDGEKVSKPTARLAMLLEEPRIEGRIAGEVSKIGAAGLDWTLRASAMALLPLTQISTDPDQAIMDIFRSWILRAGRQYALSYNVGGYNLPSWVYDFTALLHTALIDHLTGEHVPPPTVQSVASKIVNLAMEAITMDRVKPEQADTSTYMVDKAQEILALLYPNSEGEGEGGPGEGIEMGSGCSAQPAQPGEAGSEPGESGDSGDEQGEGEGSEPGEGGEDGDGVSGNLLAELDAEARADDLALMERKAKAATMDAADEAKTESEQKVGGSQGGAGSGNYTAIGEFRLPTPKERDTAKEAETFLRRLIEPTESSKITLDSSPSATVDGAALSAWRAGGSVREPHFFKRTHRVEQPAPPIKIAILVDVSASMDVLQKPSALLSWALASACVDLRNFAGRGQQIESTLIHWGDRSTVIQHNGKPIPGIREVRCDQGTSDMHRALDLAEAELPGLFDITDKPVNRLVVQFTDWRLSSSCYNQTRERLTRLYDAGVNMLTVTPKPFVYRYTSLDTVLPPAGSRRTTHSIIEYDPSRPGEVWDQAAQMLGSVSGNEG